MSVYVDSANLPFRRMRMCHLIADSTEELLEFVDKIGVQRKWIQHAGTYREHFDICLTKKQLALQSGAIEISEFELGRKLQARKTVPA